VVNITPDVLNTECPKSEAVFYDTMIYPLSEAGKELKEIKSKLTAYFQHIAKLKDDRLLVLVANLLLENTVDNYLSAIMPAYEENISAKKRDFTFSSKICIAKALKLSPSQFLDGVNLVRKIRNEFAHNLKTETFDALPPKLIEKIETILKTYYPTKYPTEKSIQEQFKSLTLSTYIALNATIENIRSLNSFLRAEEFRHSLLAYCQNQQQKT